MEPLLTFSLDSWHTKFAPALQSQAIESLEGGQLLFFPQLAFQLTASERPFLSAIYADPKFKNISYNCHTEILRGAKATNEEQLQLTKMLQRFLQHAKSLINNVLPHYNSALILGRTSFRPLQVSQRKISPRKDDKRLHVDAFPANPNQGQRILRVFSNVNPNGEDRVWRVGEPFEKVAKQFLPQIKKPLPGSAHLLKLLNITKSHRTEYDHIMLQIHDRMKGDDQYQQEAQQTEIRLPPASSWIVQTDHVSHAALAGQFLLEQTFYLPVNAMLDPQQSPLRILERLRERGLV